MLHCKIMCQIRKNKNCLNIFFTVQFLYKSAVQMPMKDFVRFMSSFAQKSYEAEIERIQPFSTKPLKITEALLYFLYLLSLAESKSCTEIIKRPCRNKEVDFFANAKVHFCINWNKESGFLKKIN